MKELRVRLLVLFTSTGCLMAAGYFDTRAPETYVLTDTHLILRPDQVEDAPSTFVVEADELVPPSEENALEPVTVEVAREPATVELEPTGAVVAEDEQPATEETEETEVAWGPAKLGDKRRVKTYLASAETTEPVRALPFAAAPAVIAKAAAPIEVKLTPAIPSRAPAAVASPVFAASVRPTAVVSLSKARPATIACALEIESPNGGEELSQSVGERVLWRSSGGARSVRLKLMKGEEDLGTLTLVQDDGATLIRIPDLVEPGPGYRLRIEAAQDPSCFDESDAEFSIRP